jgi:hypothetical protein
MQRLVALGAAVIFGVAALGARPAQAAVDRLAPFLGEFQGQSGQVPGDLLVPLWSKPLPFDVAFARHDDELLFAVGANSPVVMRFVPVSDRLYLLHTDRAGASGFAWVDPDKLTLQAMVTDGGAPARGMRFVISFEDDHRRLAAYTIKGADEPVEILDTALKSPED